MSRSTEPKHVKIIPAERLRQIGSPGTAPEPSTAAQPTLPRKQGNPDNGVVVICVIIGVIALGIFTPSSEPASEKGEQAPSSAQGTEQRQADPGSAGSAASARQEKIAEAPRIVQAPTPTMREVVERRLSTDLEKFEFDGGQIRVQFDTSEKLWNSPRYRFLKNTHSVIPEVFKTFSEVNEVLLVGTSMFVDLRGNETRRECCKIRFSRSNSDKIRWDNIDRDNLPRIADWVWFHPAVLTSN